MALTGNHLHDGVLYARGESNLTVQDAKAWVAELKTAIADQGSPVVALLDLSRASRIASQSYILIADVARGNMIKAVICVAQGAQMVEAVRTIAAMSERGRVHLFESMSEARLFAEVCAHNSQTAYA